MKLTHFLDGDTRTIRRFLWFPIYVKDTNYRESRWLEWATVKETYHIGPMARIWIREVVGP